MGKMDPFCYYKLFLKLKYWTWCTSKYVTDVTLHLHGYSFESFKGKVSEKVCCDNYVSIGLHHLYLWPTGTLYFRDQLQGTIHSTTWSPTIFPRDKFNNRHQAKVHCVLETKTKNADPGVMPIVKFAERGRRGPDSNRSPHVGDHWSTISVYSP